MIVQVLKKYSHRTEYKILKKYIDIEECSMENINIGVLLLPGIILSRLEKSEIKILKDWLSTASNQLIITPAIIECNIREFFDASIDLIIVKDKELDYEGIQCEYRIESKSQEKIFKNEKGDFGIHYRKDMGSGVLTIITLPLLDYKLSYKHNEFKKYFNLCVNKKILVKEVKKTQNHQIEIQEEHLQLLMFFAAGYELDKDLIKLFNQYFSKKLEIHQIEKLSQELEEKKLIEEQKLTDIGMILVKERRLKSFIKVLEGGRRIDEW